MHVVLPKVRKSDGKLVNTSILASQINGIEEKVVKVNGTDVQGSKVYGPHGSFYVPVHPILVMQAQAQAIESKNPVMIEMPKMKMIMLDATVQQLSYNNPATMKLLNKSN